MEWSLCAWINTRATTMVWNKRFTLVNILVFIGIAWRLCWVIFISCATYVYFCALCLPWNGKRMRIETTHSAKNETVNVLLLILHRQPVSRPESTVINHFRRKKWFIAGQISNCASIGVGCYVFPMGIFRSFSHNHRDFHLHVIFVYTLLGLNTTQHFF